MIVFKCFFGFIAILVVLFFVVVGTCLYAAIKGAKQDFEDCNDFLD